MDGVKIDPVSLFNYRLSCAINRDLQEVEIDDFESLCTAFEHHLHHHGRYIDVNTAKIVAGGYPIIQQVLSDVGLELEVVQKWTRPSAPPAGRNEGFCPPVADEKQQVPSGPIFGCDRYGQAIHARGEKMASPSGTSREDFGVRFKRVQRRKPIWRMNLWESLRDCFIGTMNVVVIRVFRSDKF